MGFSSTILRFDGLYTLFWSHFGRPLSPPLPRTRDFHPELRRPLPETNVPGGSRDAARYDQDGEIPQATIAQPGTASKDDEKAGQLISDRFIGELDKPCTSARGFRELLGTFHPPGRQLERQARRSPRSDLIGAHRRPSAGCC